MQVSLLTCPGDGARSQNFFGPWSRVHLHPYLMYGSSKGSGESAHLHRLA